MSEQNNRDDMDRTREVDQDLINQDATALAENGEQAQAASASQQPLLQMREEEKQPRISAKAKKEIREWVVSIAFALIAVFIIRTFLFTVISVDGQSMETTLHNGERMIVTVLDMKLNGPQRGDVVICHYPDRSENFVKRVIGVPGDIIWMTNGKTYINLEEVDEPYVADPDMRSYGPYTVPEGSYFVCGDNRNHSNDSRSPQVGFLTRDMFVGKVRFVMWPLNQVRTIH